MANAKIKHLSKNSAWFTTNAALVLDLGRIIFLTGSNPMRWKVGDGTTALSALNWANEQTLAETLANGNTTGANDISVNAGQKIKFGNNSFISKHPSVVVGDSLLVAVENGYIVLSKDFTSLISEGADGYLQIGTDNNYTVFDENEGLSETTASTLINLNAPSVKKNGDELATENYVNNEISSAVVGLLDDRGNYDASSNLFPSTGGSGTAGAVLKGDLWTVSVNGTLGGVAVTVGDVVRALVDTPAQTAANWVVTENNIGYVPENNANKSTSIVTDQASNIKFPSVKSVYDWAVGLFQTLANKLSVSEINTGTDDVKFPTSLGLEGSKYLTQSGSKLSATASGTNTYTATITPAITAYANTQRFFINFTNSNTVTNPTLNLNSLGAKNFVQADGSAINVGALQGIVCLAYNGTAFQIVGRKVGTGAGSVMAGNLVAAKQNTTIAHTGTTSETVLATYLHSEGQFSANDVYNIFARFGGTSSANNKTVILYFNTTPDLTGSPVQIGRLVFTTNNVMNYFTRDMVFKNSLTSQQIYFVAATSGASDWTAVNSSPPALTIDFTINQYLIVTGTLASSGETLNMFSMYNNILR